MAIIYFRSFHRPNAISFFNLLLSLSVEDYNTAARTKRNGTQSNFALTIWNRIETEGFYNNSRYMQQHGEKFAFWRILG